MKIESRVLHVMKFYRPDFTGEGVFLERSSAVMQELAGQVEHDLLVTHTHRPKEPGVAAVCSTLRRVVHLTRGPVSAFKREWLLFLWFLLNLRRYDVVHFRTHADWYFVSYLMTRLAGKKLVLSATLDDSLPVLVNHYRPSLRGLAARGLRLFDEYVAISPKLDTENRAWSGDPAHCHLIPCGVTVPPVTDGVEALRHRLGLAADALVLLFVGGLCQRKDPLLLITAMPAILARHPTTQLVLVGPPLEMDYVAALHAAAAPFAAHVHFAGEQLDPHPWFSAADVLVFASRLEGFGTVVPEAMGHGLPVVARHLPGVNDSFVLPGTTGYLFDDEAGYLHSVLRLLDDGALRVRLGAAGAALVEREFSMRQAATRYLGVYGLSDAVQPPAPGTPPTGLGSSASIADSRFHAPAEHALPRPDEAPLLVTMIDAEEAFDWSAPFSRNARDVTSMGAQWRAHRVFERHNVVPVYLADHPVASQDAGIGPLRELLADRACDVGAQLHPWVNPPYSEALGEDNSFAGNLPVAAELAKAEVLTNALTDAFGQRPLIYRTGRFGVGLRTGDVLKRLGYLADSSVAPCWPPASLRHEPAAWAATPGPYWVDRERTLMEIPVSAALVGALSGPVGHRLAPTVFSPWAERLHLPGIAARLGLLERIRLTPEGMTIEEAKRLARSMLAGGHRVFVLTYHSPSLEPGNTPYVRDLAQRDRFLAWLDEFYSFFREELGGRVASWQEVRFGPVTARVSGTPTLVASR